MFAAIFILFFLPWLDKSPVKSMKYKGWWSKVFFVLLIVSIIGLGYLGLVKTSVAGVIAARVFTILYLAIFYSCPLHEV